MALKRIITADEHKALDAKLQAEYKADGEGFVLDLTDYEDPVKLKSAKDHEKKARQEAEKLARELKEQLDALTDERDNILKGNIPKADVEKLEGSWKSKLDKREKELSEQITAANSSLQKLLVDNVAQSLASKISTAPAVIMPHIKARLRAEKGENGEFITKVVDADGKPSALTVAELEKEFVLNKDFAPIITGSKASGGGAGGGGGGGGANTGKVDFTKSPKEIAAQMAAQGKVRERAE